MKNKINYTLIFLLSSLLLMPVIYAKSGAKTTSKKITMTLKDAIALAVRTDPNIQMDSLSRTVSKYNLVSAKNAFEPKYSFESTASYSQSKSDGSYSYTHGLTVTPKVTYKNHFGTEFSLKYEDTIDQYHNPGIVLTITQPLIRGFGKAVVNAALQKAIYNEKSNQLTFKNSIMSEIETVINDYLTIIQNKERLAVDNAALKNTHLNIKKTEALIHAGRSPRNDLLQSESQKASQQATIQNDINALSQSKLQLLYLLGLPLDTHFDVPKHLDFRTISYSLLGERKLLSLKKAKLLALNNNPTYLIAGYTLKNIQEDYLSTKDAQKWKLDLTASAGRGNGSGGGDNAGMASLYNGHNHNESVNLNLSIPIDDVGAKSQLISEKVALENGKTTYRQSKRNLEMAIAQKRFSVLQQAKQLAFTKQSVRLKQKTLDMAQIKYQAGLLSNFELLQDQQDLTTTQQSLITDQIAYLNNVIDFDHDLGILLDRLNIKLRY